MAMAYAPSAGAIDWLFEPSLGASATYSDNANQSHDNPEDSLILTASPGFTLRSEGSRRLQATVQYSLTGVARFGDDESDDLYHNLGAMGKAELVEDFLFIDANARISQELTSLLGSNADAIINDANRTTTGSYSVSPYVQQRFGTFADFKARYTLAGALFEDDLFSDLLTNAFNASLTSGTRFTDLNWGLDYYYRDVSTRDTAVIDGSYTYQRADLSLGYALTRKFRLIGSVGQEEINYDAATVADLDDTVWSAGFGWSPSRRASIEATMGERFFGNTYYLSASYRARESTWSVSYGEDVNDISQATLTSGTAYVWYCNGNFVFTQFPIAPDPLCTFIGTSSVPIPSLTNGLYVAKTLRAGVFWGIRKVSYSLNAFDIRRDYLLENNAQDRSQGVSAAMTYRMSAPTSLYASLALTREMEPAALSGLALDREDDLLSFTLGLNHRFDSRTTGSLTFRRYQQDSNDPTAEYTENNITAMINMSF